VGTSLRFGRVAWVALGVLSIGASVCPPGVFAQELDEHCVVSVLNRTAQVRADGSWDLPNVPAGFGQVRARATCVRNGVTLSGESEPFTVVAGRMNGIPPIVLGTTTPIPATLTITSSSPVLTQVGQTAQLTVTATYAGGPNRDVTAASTGTSYSTTNAAIAAVTSGGIVNALRSGTVIIRASNEGTAGLFAIKVQLAGDTDGDGIPDDVELDAGLNPNNPVDALEDADQDGLTNLSEFDRGTKIRDADTDDDSISDGEEVVAGADGFITNPLLADSDSDGVRDALEIATGSDPNDPASRNLPQALARIELSPATFALTVNAIILEASRQLTVTGVLKDDTTINLTSTQSGTNYTSSDLAVCNFGSPDGRVFAASDGTCTITAANSGFSAQAQGTVTSFTPTALSFVAIPGFANNVDVSGNFAYVAAGATGLQIVSISNRNAPVIVAALDTPGNANDVRVVGNLAYIADGSSGLRIVDVTNPLTPVLVGSIDTPGEAWDVAVSDNKAYVADGFAGLQIINVANPAAPNLLGAVDPPGTQKGVDIDPIRNLAVLASGTSGIHVIDVANPSNPVLIGTAVLAGGDSRDLALKGTTALVADFSRSLTAVDISVPSNPIPGASTPSNTGGLLQDVVVSGNFALGADVLFVNGVPIVDVGDPANPIPRAILNFGNFDDDNGTGVAADANFVYLTAEQGITENGATGNTRLYIGQYLSQEDRGGVAPTVQITAPAGSSTFVEGGGIPVTVAANDDIAVVSVTFTVNGQPVFTDTSFPYQFTVTAPTNVTSLQLGATAIDLGGNQGTAAVVNVSIIPDPGTRVVGRVLDSNGVPLAGATVTVLAKSTTSQGDGTFSIDAVPTVSGNIVATASAIISGAPVSGRSNNFPPVIGGVTNVGDILVSLFANGGFESGTLANWTVVPGSVVQVVTSLGPAGQFTPIQPAEGQFMALLTSAGTVPTPPGTLGSWMTRTFVAPSVASSLDFCFQFVDNDNNFFEDFFVADLLTSAGTFTLATADNITGSPAGGTRPPPAPTVSPGVTLTPAVSPKFSSGVTILPGGLADLSSWMTNRVCSSFALPSSVLGTEMTLRFRVANDQDRIADAGVVIDNVRFRFQ